MFQTGDEELIFGQGSPGVGEVKLRQRAPGFQLRDRIRPAEEKQETDCKENEKIEICLAHGIYHLGIGIWGTLKQKYFDGNGKITLLFTFQHIRFY